MSYNGISVITAHQSAMGSDVDAFLVKFSPSGTRVWGTYYGGNGTEDARSCQTDTDGNVYLAGESGSTNNIAYQGHQNTLGGGGGDAFLAKFTPSGARIFGTYYGGTDVDRSYACAVDASGNVFLAGQVLSTEVDAISESGQQNTPGGANDAFLVKFGDLLDCAGVPNGTALTGTACDDHDECTINDAWSADCACSGTLLDSDGDGVCDFNDACPGGLEPGTPCDDGNELTLDDVVGPNCACTGSPASCLVNGDCNDNDDCTTDTCVSNACVFTPLALDGIIGPTSVISLSSNFWEVDPVPGDFIYTWVLPGDWVSPGINGQSVEATVGENLGWQQICVNAFDGACSLDQCLDVFVDEFLSIEGFHWEGFASNLYSVLQDPGTDRIHLLPGTGISGRVRFTVFDATGRMLQTTSADGDPHPITFDMSGTATGVYLLHITQGPRTQVAKLLIDR